jgi:hypothetical protein
MPGGRDSTRARTGHAAVFDFRARVPVSRGTCMHRGANPRSIQFDCVVARA